MPEERRAIHAYLSIEGHKVWHAVADEEGVSLSGLLESVAFDWDETPPEGGHPRWKEIIRSARKIDAERRRRNGSNS